MNYLNKQNSNDFIITGKLSHEIFSTYNTKCIHKLINLCYNAIFNLFNSLL